MPMERALGEEEAGRRQAGSQEVSMLSASCAWSFKPPNLSFLRGWADGLMESFLGRAGGTAATGDCWAPHSCPTPREPHWACLLQAASSAPQPTLGGSCWGWRKLPPTVGASTVTLGSGRDT